MPPVRVQVTVVDNSSSETGRTYSGTVSSSETTTMSFSVAGTVKTLPVSEGQKVTKGQVIGTLDAGDYENAYNIAEAQLAEAQDGYNRLKKLHDANALPEVKWVEMEQKLKQARNAAEMAKRTLGDTVLRSPVNGTVSRKFVEPGQSVLPVQPVYEIISTSKLAVDISLSENEIGNISEGRKAIVTFDVPGISSQEAKVTSKSVSPDPLTRSYTVKIDIDPEGGKILPGMLAEVSFPANDKETAAPAAITLPSGTVILNNDNRWFVWTVKDNKALRRFVEVDQMVANGILVKSGLNPGDTVIVAGMQKVGTGTPLFPLTEN